MKKLVITDRFLTRINTEEKVWVSQDGRVTHIKELTKPHLKNIIALLEREVDDIREFEIKFLQDSLQAPNTLKQYIGSLVHRLNIPGLGVLDSAVSLIDADTADLQRLIESLKDLEDDEYLRSKPTYIALIKELDRRECTNKYTEPVLDALHDKGVELLESEIESCSNQIEALKKESRYIDDKIAELRSDIRNRQHAIRDRRVQDIIDQARRFYKVYE